MKTHTLITLIVVGLISLALSGCGSASTTPAAPTAIYQVVSEGTLKAGSTIPAPTGDTILTVTGNIGTTNADKSIKMDLATIESVGQVDYTVTDPFDKKKITYRGPLMSQLLDLWRVPSTAKVLHVVALNDYSIDVPIQDLRTYPVIFALKADGVYMPISTRGPAMLVYPYDNFTFDQAVYNDYWAWQIATIDVR